MGLHCRHWAGVVHAERPLNLIDAMRAPGRGGEVLERGPAGRRHEVRLREDLVEVDLERAADVGVDDDVPQGGHGLEEAVVAAVRAVDAEVTMPYHPAAIRFFTMSVVSTNIR